MGRMLLAMAALTLLGACNIVTTRTPMFTQADAVGAPQLRPGVWDETPAADCHVDEAKPPADWPGCTNGFVVSGDGALGGYGEKDGKRVWSSVSSILAAGDPAIFQLHDTSAAGSASSPDAYVYAGVAPTRRDAKGRVVATLSWPVLCGKPPPADAKTPDGGQRAGTLDPVPGMTMDADENNCTTTSPAAVRAAAKASRAWTTPAELTAAHWVRDGDK